MHMNHGARLGMKLGNALPDKISTQAADVANETLIIRGTSWSMSWTMVMNVK